MSKKNKYRDSFGWILLLFILFLVVAWWWVEWTKKGQTRVMSLSPEATPVPMMFVGGGGGGGVSPPIAGDFDATDFNSADFDTGTIS